MKVFLYCKLIYSRSIKPDNDLLFHRKRCNLSINFWIRPHKLIAVSSLFSETLAARTLQTQFKQTQTTLFKQFDEHTCIFNRVNSLRENLWNVVLGSCFELHPTHLKFAEYARKSQWHSCQSSFASLLNFFVPRWWVSERVSLNPLSQDLQSLFWLNRFRLCRLGLPSNQYVICHWAYSCVWMSL